jgi:hypothetical protein
MKSKVTRLALQVLCVVLLFASKSNAHKQHVHQYIAREAYLLLKSTLGGVDIPDMAAHLGPLEDPAYIGTRQWEKPYITTGAWREDAEDVVFGLRDFVDPFADGALISISHFWDADNGDESQNVFRYSWHGITGEIGPYPNAFQKMKKYAIPNRSWILKWLDGNHGHVSTFDLYGGGTINYTWFDQIGFEYISLPDLYKTGQAWVVGYYDDQGQWIDHNVRPDILPRHVVLGGGPGSYREKLVWEILGRMCHLLADMSCPAHAHRDEHGLDPDSYEDWAGGLSRPYLVWNAQNVGNYIENPYAFAQTDEDRLHYLMYPIQEISDHFGSNGPYDGEGNDFVGGNPRSYEASILNSIVPTLGAPTSQSGPFTTENLTNILNKTFPRTIRATAGLLYWFAIECELLKRVTVANDFAGGRLRIDGVTINDVPIGGISCGWFNNSWHNLFSENGQHVGNYTREFQRWQKDGVDQGSSNPREIQVTADAQWKAISKRWFDVTLNQALYFEEGGSGATYKVNNTNVGQSWVGHDVVLEGSSVLLEAIPPNFEWAFTGWSDGNTANPRTIIPTNHLSLHAVYKLHLGSSSANALAQNTQRKIVRDSGNRYHMVYESRDQIWYAQSTNNGATWSQDRQLTFEGGLWSKPSVAIMPASSITSERLFVVMEAAEEVYFSGEQSVWHCELDLEGNFISPLDYVAEAYWYNYNESAHGPVVGVARFSSPLLQPGEESGEEVGGGESVYYYPMVLWYDPSEGAVRAKVKKYGSIFTWSGTTNLLPGATDYTIAPLSEVDGTWDIAYVSNNTLHYSPVVVVQPGFPQLLAVEYVAEGTLSANVEHPSIARVGGTVGISWDLNAWEFVSGAVQYAQRVEPERWSSPVGWMPVLGWYRLSSLAARNNHAQVTIAWQNEATSLFYVQGAVDGWGTPSFLRAGVHPTMSVGFTDAQSEVALSRGVASPYSVQPDVISYSGDELQRMGPHSVSTSGRGGVLHLPQGSMRVAVLRARVDDTPLEFAAVSDTTKPRSLSEFRTALTTLPLAGTGTLQVQLMFGTDGRVPQGMRLRVVVQDAATGEVLTALRTLGNAEDTLVTLRVALNYGNRPVALSVQPIGVGLVRRFALERWYVVDEESRKPLAKGAETEASLSQLPTEFAVHPNYPNPFNPTTTIKYDLPEDSHVSLVIYDVLGRKVAELESGVKEAGYHSTTWNASSVASGVYFARFAATDASGHVRLNSVTKLLLTK